METLKQYLTLGIASIALVVAEKISDVALKAMKDNLNSLQEKVQAQTKTLGAEHAPNTIYINPGYKDCLQTSTIINALPWEWLNTLKIRG